MTDSAYLKRRAAQESELASTATNRRAAAAHDAMALVYFKKLAMLADLEEQRIANGRPVLL